MWQRALPACLLVGLSAIAYLNADHEAFLFDSEQLIRESRWVGNLGGAIAELWRSPVSADEQLAHASFALNRAVNRAFGLPAFDVTGFLVFNVALHALNAILVFLLIRMLLGMTGEEERPATWIALFAAAWFAAHPIQASSVAYIAQRRGTMAATFYLLGVLAYLKARSGPARSHVSSAIASASAWRMNPLMWLVALVLCYWLSVRSKSAGLTLPVMILSIEFCLRAKDQRALRRFLKWAVPAAVVVGLGGLLFLWRTGVFDPRSFTLRSYSATELSGPWTHLLTSSRAFVHYWKLLVLPLPQWSCADHLFKPSSNPGEHGAFLAIAFHSIALAWAIFAARRGRVLFSLGVLWFYVALAPYAIVPQANAFVEYKAYLAGVGGALILAELARRLNARLARPVRLGLATALLIGLLAVTIYRNRVYQSPLNFWGDVLAKYPNHLRGHVGLANAWRQAGQSERAMEHFRRAIAIHPGYAQAHFDLANLLDEQGRIHEAIAHYGRALGFKSDYPEAHYNLARLLARIGNPRAAIKHYASALELQPQYAEAHNNLAILLASAGRRQEAIGHYEEALRIRPEMSAARFSLAVLLKAEGRLSEAVDLLEELIESEPDHERALRQLAETLRLQGREVEAIEYEKRLANTAIRSESRREE